MSYYERVIDISSGKQMRCPYRDVAREHCVVQCKHFVRIDDCSAICVFLTELPLVIKRVKRRKAPAIYY